MAKIKLFAVLKKVAGKDEIALQVGNGMKLKDVLLQIKGEFPQVVDLVKEKKVMVSVNQEIADENTIVKEEDEVGILPPFAGGSVGATELVRIQRENFSVDEEIARVKKSSTGIGGIVTFLGIARDNSKGRDIGGLSFEYYEGMAQKRLLEIREKAIKDFDIIEVGILHRYGEITIGENIVLIVVGAAHRAEAFKACKWVIDELKQITPIWKKEETPEGEVWVDYHP
ncbi:MAG TPA: molybdenum cofactor biosynthesis protein MoaE [Nitrospiria bacterium]|jgi:molybdopterin synthase catalytic subunit